MGVMFAMPGPAYGPPKSLYPPITWLLLALMKRPTPFCALAFMRFCVRSMLAATSDHDASGYGLKHAKCTTACASLMTSTHSSLSSR